MELMDLFYPPFTPPPSIGRITHKSAFAGEPKYVEPKKPKGRPKRDENALCPSEEKALKILAKKAKPMTSHELAPLMKMTQNHCGIIMTSLFKKGRLDRIKYHKPGTRFYRYTVKDDENGSQ